MKLKVSSFLLTLLCLIGCSYSFSDFSIDAKTASVGYFENLAPIQNATLSQEFTNKLESSILRDTPLVLVKKTPDVEFTGAIVGYSITPESVVSQDKTAQTRLTVTVSIDYVNHVVESRSFQQTFQASETYDSNLDLSSVEEQLIDTITDQLVQTIFNKAFSNW